MMIMAISFIGRPFGRLKPLEKEDTLLSGAGLLQWHRLKSFGKVHNVVKARKQARLTWEL